MISDQLILLLISHSIQWIIFAFVITSEFIQSINCDFLYSSSFSTITVWWQAETTDASSCSNATRHDVFLVQFASFDVGWIQIGLVFFVFGVSVMSVLDDRVQKLGEDIVGFFISSDATDGVDEGMSRIVNTSLDDAINGETVWCDLLA